MALVINKNFGSYILGVWEISEDEDYFIEALSLDEKAKNSLSRLKGRRKVEWLAARHLVNVLQREIGMHPVPISKDKYGKPFLSNSPKHISISHTNKYAAAILSDLPCGIDIQIHVDKITRIQEKFLSAEELLHINERAQEKIKLLHYYWGAKESLYKAYGRKKLEFKKHLFIQNLSFTENVNSRGFLMKEDYKRTFNLFHDTLFQKYYLIYAIEIL